MWMADGCVQKTAMLTESTAGKPSMATAINSFSLKFTGNKPEVTINLDCLKTSGNASVTYYLSYKAKTLNDNSLLIEFGLNGKEVKGAWEAATFWGQNDPRNKAAREGNLLEFFTKANWLYSKKNDTITGISQLGNLGYPGNATIELKDEKSFSDAIDQVKTKSEYDIKPKVGAISFILNKKP